MPGGTSADTRVIAGAEVYDPATRRFNTVAGSSDTERFFPAVTAMGGDRVLISGGYASEGAQRGTRILQP